MVGLSDGGINVEVVDDVFGVVPPSRRGGKKSKRKGGEYVRMGFGERREQREEERERTTSSPLVLAQAQLP